MAGRTIKPVAALTISAASTDGYATVSSVTGFYKNAFGYITKSDFTTLEVQITEIQAAATKLGIRLWNRALGTGYNFGRDDISAYAPETRLAFITQTSPFNVGATVTGGTSAAHGVIARIFKTSPTAGYLVLTGVVGNFTNAEALTDNGGVPGGATASGTQFTVSATISTPKQFIYNPNDLGLA